MKTELKNSIENFLRELNTEVDVLYYVKIEDIDYKYAFDSIRDMIDANGGFDIEIIYYSNAIDYLGEHDPSLIDSLTLANEMGFSVDSLNSEILASLLASQNSRDDFNDLEEEINNFFESLEEEEED